MGYGIGFFGVPTNRHVRYADDGMNISESIEKGVFFHPRHHWFSCFSHTDEDVKITLQRAKEALNAAKKSI